MAKGCLDCISESIRCKKFILGTDIVWVVGVQRHDVALI